MKVLQASAENVINSYGKQAFQEFRQFLPEDRQFLIDELERLAGVGVTGGTKTVEMELCWHEFSRSAAAKFPFHTQRV